MFATNWPGHQIIVTHNDFITIGNRPAQSKPLVAMPEFLMIKHLTTETVIHRMIQVYNFLGSWQLFPEKGNYETGERPKSRFYKIEKRENNDLSISQNWVTLENTAFITQYDLAADGNLHAFADTDLADKAQISVTGSHTLEFHFYRDAEIVLHVLHHILPNGHLKLTEQGIKADKSTYTNTEIYHRQMSVLPYSSSVGGVVIKPTEEGLIKHKALTAMEDQTNMQLDQIRQQIELLAMQAREIQTRKELSMMIYGAKLSFSPNIGQTYFLYTKKDDSFLLSMVSPKEWGKIPFKKFEAAVKLLADHTWIEVS